MAGLLLFGLGGAAAPQIPPAARPAAAERASVTPAGSAQVVRGELSDVTGVGADPALLRDLARRADTAARRVSAVLGTTVTPHVVVPASTAEAARLAAVGSVAGLAALADGDRVIVVPDGFARLTPTGRDVVLTHELTHVAAGTRGLPPWLYEGFADYVAYKDSGLSLPVAAAELRAEVRAGRVPRALPGPGGFAPGTVRLAQSYQEAWLACRFLAERFGEERLVALYRDARARGVDRALRATAGLDVARLTGMWRDYVRERLG